MKIKSVSCEQFAGLTNKSIEFEDGLNIIVGDNETGKSTLVDLIYTLYFNDPSKLSKKDTQFIAASFPRKASSIQADYINGMIVFSADDGQYILGKLWDEKKGECKMQLPDGMFIKDPAKINSILENILKYGKGVYDELVFPTQRRENAMLNGLLGKGSDGVKEFASSVNMAMMETGGVGVDKVEDEINTILKGNNLTGKNKVAGFEGNWDFKTNSPKLDSQGRRKGRDNKWSNGNGSIIEAYYKKEDSLFEYNGKKSLETKLDQEYKNLDSIKLSKNVLAGKKTDFLACKDAIRIKQDIVNLENDIECFMKDFEEWPIKEKKLEKAKSLDQELAYSEVIEQYSTVDKLLNEKSQKEKELEQFGNISDEILKVANAIQDNIEDYESKLRGLDLIANIVRLGSADVIVRSMLTGEEKSINSDMDITEAIEIEVPGIVNIKLMPKGTDAASISNDLANEKKELLGLLKKQSVKSLDELEEKFGKYQECKEKIGDLQSKIDEKLDGETFEELKGKREAIKESVRDSQVIKDEMNFIIEDDEARSFEAYYGGLEQQCKSYMDDYTSLEQLENLIAKNKAQREKLEKKIEGADNIPEEFKAIDNEDAYLESIELQLEQYDTQIESLRQTIGGYESEIGDISAEDMYAVYEEDDEAFERLKEEYSRWKHIQEVFISIKESMKGNPLEDVEKQFKEYLTILSDGSLGIDSMDDKMKTSFVSNKNKLENLDTVSDGTKDTISLAFRLAVLRHLFPEGGAVAVFDDPFADMDPTRTEKACKLIEEFAKENQVIFVTCDDKYTKMMKSGHTIKVER